MSSIQINTIYFAWDRWMMKLGNSVVGGDVRATLSNHVSTFYGSAKVRCWPPFFASLVSRQRAYGEVLALESQYPRSSLIVAMLTNSHLDLSLGCRHRHSAIPASSCKDFLWLITSCTAFDSMLLLATTYRLQPLIDTLQCYPYDCGSYPRHR